MEKDFFIKKENICSGYLFFSVRSLFRPYFFYFLTNVNIFYMYIVVLYIYKLSFCIYAKGFCF